MSKSLEIMRNIRDTYAHMAECHEGEPQGTLAADWAAAADEAIKAMGAATTDEISAMDSIITAFNTWPDDIKKKLSLHDLRRMSGWAPRSGVGDWRIDTSAGGPILVYQDCSVIEGEQARYLMNLIKSDNALAALMESKSPWERSPSETVGMALNELANENARLGLTYENNQQAAREWLPITECVRKHDLRIWAYLPEFDEQCVLRWCEALDWSGWLYVDSVLNDMLDCELEPSHYMPLPAPPRPTQERGTHE